MRTHECEEVVCTCDRCWSWWAAKDAAKASPGCNGHVEPFYDPQGSRTLWGHSNFQDTKHCANHRPTGSYVEPKETVELEKDETDYFRLVGALSQAIQAVGAIKVNVRNDDILSTMYEDLTHMRGELAGLIDEQAKCPYDLN